jgi:hypothetical protein
MMTDSLSKDGDFNLKNDYELNRASKYYPIPSLFPHLAPIIDYKNSDKWYSIHTIGLPILIVLPYKIHGVLGARIIVTLAQLLSVYLFYLILKKYLKDEVRVIIGLILVISCSLFWQNFGAIFPDFFTLLFLEISILLFARKDYVSNFGLLLLNIFGLLIHTKIILLIGPIYIAHNLYLIKTIGFRNVLKKYFTLYLMFILGVVLYIRFLKTNYGIISPSQIYGTKGQLFSGNPLINTIAILTDRGKGIIVFYPVLAVAGVYIYRALKGAFIKFKSVFSSKDPFNSEAYLIIGAIAGLVLLLVTQVGFNDWSGSFSPVGRYMMVFVFLIIFFMAKYLDLKNKLEFIVLMPLVFISFIIANEFIFNTFIYTDTGKEFPIIAKLDYFGSLPLFPLISDAAKQETIIKGAMVFIALVLFNIGLYWLYKVNKKFARHH